jgi:hypothetical protein
LNSLFTAPQVTDGVLESFVLLYLPWLVLALPNYLNSANELLGSGFQYFLLLFTYSNSRSIFLKKNIFPFYEEILVSTHSLNQGSVVSSQIEVGGSNEYALIFNTPIRSKSLYSDAPH